MKKQFFLGAVGVLIVFSGSARSNNITCQEADSLARQAFAYCLATVEHNKMLKRALTGFPSNVFWGEAELNSPEDSMARFPNNDTYYNLAVLDIRYEPVVISIPKVKDRYYNIQMVDFFTNYLDYISMRSTGEGPGNFLIARTDWDGEVPEGIVKVIKSPATVLLALNRIQVFSGEDDEAKVLHAGFKIKPLSEYMGKASPPKEPLSWDFPSLDAKACSIEEYFNLFNQLMAYQLLTPEEQHQLERFSVIGIIPGKEFKKSNFSSEIWDAIEKGATKARDKIKLVTEDFSDTVFGWRFPSDYCGRFGDNYYARAKAAWEYMYANHREEAMYYFARVDSNNEALNGLENKYVMIFSKDFIPRPKYFWSLTMYNKKGQLIKNELSRYSLSNVRSSIKYEKDGSFMLHIQKESPGEDKKSNWLPAPDEDFVLVFRSYGADAKFRPVPPLVRTNMKQ